MALGVEYGCKYVLEGSDGTKAVFNDSSDPDFVGILNPENCSGLDSAEVREDAADKSEDDGRVQGNNYFSARPIVLAGTIIASSTIDRATKIDKILAASLALRSDSTLTWYPVDEPTGVSVKVRRNQPTRVTKGYVKEFQIPLVANDPRIYGALTAVSSAGVTVEKTGSVFNSVAGSGGSVVWGTPSNAGSSNNVYATAALEAAGEASKSQWLISKGYGFAIPAEAVVTNWRGYFEGKSSAGGTTTQMYLKRLDASGAIAGTGGSLLYFPGTSDTNAELNMNSSDGITPTLANDVDFGFGLFIENKTGVSRTYSLDLMKMFLSYMVPIISVVNNGNAETFPTISLNGPFTSPVTVKNKTTGKTIKIEAGIESSSTMTIDMLNKTIKIGTTDEYSKLVFTESEWWGLIPGMNEIEVSVVGATNNSKATIEFRDAYA